jgi:hypothetical protein
MKYAVIKVTENRAPQIVFISTNRIIALEMTITCNKNADDYKLKERYLLKSEKRITREGVLD